MSSIRRLTFSPAAAVLEDGDLLSEILLRLSPQPSSLPRASLVCKQWRSLVADPGFIRGFRLRHRPNRPLLGCFIQKPSGLSFVPTMDAPNRVPAGRFSWQSEKRNTVLGCRHGLVLLSDESRKQVLVRDPVTANQHRIPVPAGFGKTAFHGAVLRSADDGQHFQVVLAMADNKDKQHRQVLACVYSSETAVWGDLVSAPLPPMPTPPTNNYGILVSLDKPAVLAENSLYWILAGDFVGILEFDLERKKVAMIQAPVDVLIEGKHTYTVMRAESGGLGFLSVPKSDCIAQLWKRLTDCGGVSSWVLDRTIELDKLLPLNSLEERAHLWMLGFAEDNNVLFLWTFKGVFMIHLKLLQFEQLPGGNLYFCSHPFESVYAAEDGFSTLKVWAPGGGGR